MIIEEQLAGYDSHHFDYITNLASWAREAGAEVTILCNRSSPLELTAALGAKPILHGTSPSSLNSIRGGIRRRIALAWGVVCNAWVLLRELNGASRADVVLVTTTWIPHLLSVWPVIWLRRRNIGRVRFQFLCQWDASRRGHMSLVQVARCVMKAMERTHPNVRFLAQSHVAAADLRECGGPEVGVVHDVACPVADTRRVRDIVDSRTVVFGSFGFARHEQGADVLLQVIREISEKRPDLPVHFHVFWPGAGFSTPDGHWVTPDDTLARSGKVTFYRRRMTRDETSRLMLASDWVLLPYRPESYARRASRIAVDAASYGRPAIYTCGTEQETVFREHGAGIGLAGVDAEQLMAAILCAVQENDRFQASARARAAEAVDAFSAKEFWSTMDVPFVAG